MGEKFKFNEYTEKNYKKEFILSCFMLPKSRHKEINWAQEMKIMNGLAAKKSDYKFWYHARPDFKLNSLAWFLTPRGRKYLNEKWLLYNKEQKVKSPLPILNEKIGEDFTPPVKKMKTLKDFLTSRN